MLRLYHGSKSGLTGTIAPVSRVSCDFGPGFYMGESVQQPETLICRAESPRLYELEFDSTGLSVLEVGSDLLWALVVACHRGAMGKYEGTPLHRHLTNAIVDRRRHLDGIYFDELCERYADGEGLPAC